MPFRPSAFARRHPGPRTFLVKASVPEGFSGLRLAARLQMLAGFGVWLSIARS